MLLDFHGDIADVPDPPTVSSIIDKFSDVLACWDYGQPLALGFGY